MSCRRPSNASSRVSGPCGPVSARLASTSAMGRRRRAAAIASPSRVCAFSRIRSLSSSAWKAARPTAAGRLGVLVPPAAGPPRFADSSFMASSLDGSARAFFPCFCVRRFGEPFDRGEPPVPPRGEVSHGPGGLVETAGFYLVENLPALLAPADQPGLFKHGQMLGDRLAGERHAASQPAGADVTVADEEVEYPATRRGGDGRAQLPAGLRRHPDWRFASRPASRSRYSAQPPWCSAA